MANPFYTALAGVQNGGNVGPVNNGSAPAMFDAMLQQLKANPLGFLLQMKLNVPANIANDPTAIMSHLIRTGQMSPARLNSGYQLLQNMGRRS